MESLATLSPIFDAQEWDAPFYKRLAKNDTGEARGHQSGFLLPKGLRCYFPSLPSGQLTTGVKIQADLYVESRFIQRTNSRYQYQTWKGKRRPETRVTDGLRPILNDAVGGDFLVMRRHLDYPDRYCFQLIREGDPAYEELKRVAEHEGNAGTLGSHVLATTEINDEIDTLRNSAENDESFDPFSSGERRSTASRRPLRRAAFAQLVLREYSRQCCVCDSGLVSPAGPVAVEAAHIIPVAAGGIDDPRNALALCRNHHWAFDNGLFTVSEDMMVKISDSAGKIPENDELKSIADKFIKPPKSEDLRPHQEALKWHKSHVFIE